MMHCFFVILTHNVRLTVRDRKTVEKMPPVIEKSGSRIKKKCLQCFLVDY